MSRRVSVSAFVVFLALLMAPLVAPPADARTVVISDPDGDFEELARQIQVEIEALLAAEREPWRVERSVEPVDVARAGDGGDDDQRIVIALVGPAAALAAPTVDGSKGSIDVLVDPLGLLEDRADERAVDHSAAVDRSAGPTIRGVSFDDAVAQDLELVLELLASAEQPPSTTPRVLVPLDPRLEPLRTRLEHAAAGLDLRLYILSTAGEPVDEWIDAPDEELDAVEALYVPPGASFDRDAIEEIAVRLLFGAMPSVSGRGPADLEAGLLAAFDRDGRELARRVALAVLSRVRGLPMGASRPSARSPRLSIALETADLLGMELPWSLRLRARRVGLGFDEVADEPPKDMSRWSTTLEAARAEALGANLDLLARRLATAASEEQVRLALAELRPRVDLTLQGRLIDEDTAVAAFGAQPERLVSALGEASWLLFSDGARAAVDIERRLQLARTLELDELRLDVALAATASYLEVARAMAFAAIARADLELTLADLDAAESRRAVGASGRADVARLEARAAAARRALVEAAGTQRTAAISFNRLLARPLERPVEIGPHGWNAGRWNGGGDPVESGDALPLEETFVSPRALARLERTLLDEAFGQAPEIAAADAVVDARRRGLPAARRAFFLPAVRAFASLEERLVEEGAGTEPPSLPLPGVGFPDPPGRTWALGLEATLPLWDGGARGAAEARAALDLESAEILRDAAAQRVEERLRLAIVGVETAYEAARQAREAVDAAVVAFEVVRDAYARGVETLTALLDVQSQLLDARRASAAARIAALVRWAELERATGRFDRPLADESPDTIRGPQ